MTLGLPLHTHGRVSGVSGVAILKVLRAAEVATSGLLADQCVVMDEAGDLAQARQGDCQRAAVTALKDRHVVDFGDVIRLRQGSNTVSVAWRRSAKSNALFATERCNSACLMCSQPPREVDDNWRVEELLRIAALIDEDADLLTITGGEPTLLGDGLCRILEAVLMRSPDTQVQVLSNGRGFRDPKDATRWIEAGGSQTRWAIPLYSDAPQIHDHIVQAPGAFDETVDGLFQLALADARVEIRVVLHKLTTPRLRALATLIYRRMPFVEHVALMGLEPMGFAKGNREALWIDPAEYLDDLSAAAFYLANRGIAVSIYNLPLCVLPRTLWFFARQSISEWKNTFAPECASCSVRARCAGFFASAGAEWRSRAVRPIFEGELEHEMA